jgi:hypothetical protein
VANKSKHRDFDTVADELREELRGHLEKAARFDAARFDEAIYPSLPPM